MAARHISNFIIVNGKPFPAPKRYPNMVVTTAVKCRQETQITRLSVRRLEETIIRLTTLNGRNLDAETWSDMLKMSSKILCNS